MPKPDTIRIPLKSMEPMPGNRECGSGMDEKSLGELAESIKTHGILQNLLVRPHPKKKDHYEIVAGTRRWTAGLKAKAADAPCKVLELTDAEARELRLIENLHREGIHEIEEARGYQELLALRNENGTTIHTVESIAKRVNKSLAYIYARLKLLRMPEVAQEAFLSGKLNASVALLLSRIPDPKKAYAATLEVLDRYGSGITESRAKRALDPNEEAMSFRNARDHLQRKYMIRLKGAKFDPEDAELVTPQWLLTADDKQLTLSSPVAPVIPAKIGKLELFHEKDKDGAAIEIVHHEGKDLFKTRSKADAQALVTFLREAGQTPVTCERAAGGKCSDCPFRTGVLKKLYPSLYGDVESTDVCTNTACFQSKVKAKVKADEVKCKEKGQILMSAGRTRELFAWDGKELSAAARSKYLDLREKPPGRKKTWEELLEPHLPEGTMPTLARTDKKNFLLLPIEQALPAIKAAGIKFDPPKPREEHDYQKERQLAEERRAISDEIWKEILPRIEVSAAKRKPEELLREVARSQAEDEDELKWIAKATLIDLSAALYMRSLPDFHNWHGHITDGYTEICKEHGIDLKKIVAEKEAAWKARKAKEAEAAKNGKAEAKPEAEPAKK